MITESATFVLTYYTAALVQTLSHRIFGHTKRLMPIYSSHTHGHHTQYRRSALLQEKWIASERHVLWYFVIPFAAIALTLLLVAPLSIFLIHLSALAFSIWVHIALHRHYHIRGSPLERLAWFRRKRFLHFVHHRRVRSNYAIVENWIDRLLGTYRDS
jgi:hypothetical protein